jgi:hypothetical protein
MCCIYELTEEAYYQITAFTQFDSPIDVFPFSESIVQLIDVNQSPADTLFRVEGTAAYTQAGCLNAGTYWLEANTVIGAQGRYDPPAIIDAAYAIDCRVTTVPEPASTSLFAFGLAGLAYASRQWRRGGGVPARAWCITLMASLLLPTTARAESVSVTPVEWDFGNVVVGESASTTFRIEIHDMYEPVTFGVIRIEDSPLAAYEPFLAWGPGLQNWSLPSLTILIVSKIPSNWVPTQAWFPSSTSWFALSGVSYQ